MKQELTEEQKEQRRTEREIQRRPGKFATKVRNHMKKEGLRSGELLLEYWKKPDPSASSLEKLNMSQEVIIQAVEDAIEKYKDNI